VSPTIINDKERTQQHYSDLLSRTLSLTSRSSFSLASRASVASLSLDVNVWIFFSFSSRAFTITHRCKQTEFYILQFIYYQSVQIWIHLTNNKNLAIANRSSSAAHTNIVQGISVTLKSTLRVTHDNRKRNHWTDHTRLSSSRVTVTLKCGLEVTESGTIWKLGYGFLFAFHSNYGRICSR